jgi:uncharacterized protein (TIGR03663 family)
MAAGGKGRAEEWRLGVELGTLEEFDAAEAAPGALRDHSAERLERPLCVVTAEHLGWAAVACWALVSRLVMLGARPLDSAEARHALDALALLRNGEPAGAHLSWVHLLEAATFAAFGAGDFAARIAHALSGLLLVGAGFAMRRHLGRAGALAFAALLVLSPSAAYFSRAGYAVVPALACAVLALAVFLELTDKPTPTGAAGLGAIAGLGLASAAPALMTALFMLAALAVVGAGQAIVGRRVLLQVRVWWTRRKSLLLISVLVAAALWGVLESGFATRSPLDAIMAAARSNLAPAGSPGFKAGLDFYLPVLSLYEFLVVTLAALGALAVLTIRVRSRLAAGALVWSALAIAFYLWTPARSPAFVLQMIVPMALLGAFAIDYLHHALAWNVIRYPLAALALLTLYVQGANNFVWYAPDASQAPWARSALLFWTEPATTLQAPQECARVLGELPKAGARAFFADGSPVLRWYLRGLGSAANAESASAIVGGVEPAGLPQADVQARYDFELSATWRPVWRALSLKAALRYLLGARAWTPLDTERVTIVVRPSVPSAPTVIFAPGAASGAPSAPAPPASEPDGRAASGQPG